MELRHNRTPEQMETREEYYERLREEGLSHRGAIQEIVHAEIFSENFRHVVSTAFDRMEENSRSSTNE